MPNEELEKCVRMVMATGLSTGHADTHTDLIEEVLDQYNQLRFRNQEVSKAYSEKSILLDKVIERLKPLVPIVLGTLPAVDADDA